MLFALPVKNNGKANQACFSRAFLHNVHSIFLGKMITPKGKKYYEWYKKYFRLNFFR